MSGEGDSRFFLFLFLALGAGLFLGALTEVFVGLLVFFIISSFYFFQKD
ncbi:MAG: hypothetical protein Q8N81_03880 [bacterium]|nr:hypothetical protein [bacterium]